MDKALRKDAEGKKIYIYFLKKRKSVEQILYAHYANKHRLRNGRKTHSVLGGWVLWVMSWLLPLFAVPLEAFPIKEQ